MSSNASPERVRRDILASQLRELSGFRLAIDCGHRECNGERTFDIASLAERRGESATIGDILRRMRCHNCGRQPRVVHLESGPQMAQRGGWRRIMLQGLFAIGDGR